MTSSFDFSLISAFLLSEPWDFLDFTDTGFSLLS